MNPRPLPPQGSALPNCATSRTSNIILHCRGLVNPLFNFFVFSQHSQFVPLALTVLLIMVRFPVNTTIIFNRTQVYIINLKSRQFANFHIFYLAVQKLSPRLQTKAIKMNLPICRQYSDVYLPLMFCLFPSLSAMFCLGHSYLPISIKQPGSLIYLNR